MDLQSSTQRMLDLGISKIGNDTATSQYPSWVVRDGFTVGLEKLSEQESSALNEFWIEFSTLYSNIAGPNASERIRAVNLNSLLLTLKVSSISLQRYDSVELMPVTINLHGIPEPIYDFRDVELANTWVISGHSKRGGAEELFREEKDVAISLLERMVQKTGLPVVSPMLKLPDTPSANKDKTPGMS